MCLVKQNFTYEDGVDVRIAGYGAQFVGDVAAKELRKMSASIVFSNVQTYYDHKHNFGYLNTNPPYQKTCSVGS